MLLSPNPPLFHLLSHNLQHKTLFNHNNLKIQTLKSRSELGPLSIFMFLLFFEQILLTYLGLLSTYGLTIPIMKTTSKYFLLTKILCSAIHPIKREPSTSWKGTSSLENQTLLSGLIQNTG